MLTCAEQLLAPIRKKFEAKEMQEIITKAYPPEDKKAKKAKGQKGQKQKGQKAGGEGAAGPATSTEKDVSRMDIRVGKILRYNSRRMPMTHHH